MIDGAFGGLDRDLHVGEQAADLLAEMAGPPDRSRTSSATTAKPRPASPARAASMAALSASRLVCLEIPSISPSMPLTSRIWDMMRSVNRPVPWRCGSFDDAIDKAAQGFEVWAAKASNSATELRLPADSPSAAGDDLQAQLLLPLNLPVHAVETVDQLADGFGKITWSGRSRRAHDFDLLAVLAGDAGQGAGAEVRELALGPALGDVPAGWAEAATPPPVQNNHPPIRARNPEATTHERTDGSTAQKDAHHYHRPAFTPIQRRLLLSLIPILVFLVSEILPGNDIFVKFRYQPTILPNAFLRKVQCFLRWAV